MKDQLWAFNWRIIPVIAVALVAYLVFDNQRCKYQWYRSGLERSWSPITGCMVRDTDGHWMPATNYKEKP